MRIWAEILSALILVHLIGACGTEIKTEPGTGRYDPRGPIPPIEIHSFIVDWVYDFDGKGIGEPPVLDLKRGQIYLVGKGAKARLNAIDFAGKKKWSLDQIGTRPVIGADGTIYAAWHKELHAITPDGAIKWSFEVIESGIDEIAVGRNDGIFFEAGGAIYAVSSRGEKLWRKWGPGTSCSPIVGKDGDIVIARSRSSEQVAEENKLTYLVTAFDHRGKEKWSIDLGTKAYIGRLSYEKGIGENGYYFGIGEDVLYAIHPDGKLLWKFVTNGYPYLPIVGKNGRIYLGNAHAGKLYVLDSEGKEIKTVERIRGEFEFSFLPARGAPISKDFRTGIWDGVDTIYLGIMKSFYGMTPELEIKLKFDDQEGSPLYPTLGPRGIVYMVCHDRIYALKPPRSADLAGTSWELLSTKGDEFGPQIQFLRFMKGGNLHYTYRKTVYDYKQTGMQASDWLTSGSWKADGVNVQISLKYRKTQYQGVLYGDEMKGSARDYRDEKWEWHGRLMEGGKKTEEN